MSALSSVNCVSGAVAFSTMSDSASGTGRADGRGGEAIPRKLKAEAYLKRVKEAFKDDPKLRIQYKEFLEVMKLLLNAEKIDTRKLLVRKKERNFGRHLVDESLVEFEWTVDYARRSGGDLRATMEAVLSASSW
ncbi:unnamed protein product [Calypogeia fissa]